MKDAESTVANWLSGQQFMTVVQTPTSFLAAVPQFTVADVVRTVAYYRDVLGFQVGGYWNGERVTETGDEDTVFAIVWRGEVQVFFNIAEGSVIGRTHSEGAYDVYIRVTNVDALADELRARGAEIIDGPEDRVYGQRELVVKDCNGMVLTFGARSDATSA